MTNLKPLETPDCSLQVNCSVTLNSCVSGRPAPPSVMCFQTRGEVTVPGSFCFLKRTWQQGLWSPRLPLPLLPPACVLNQLSLLLGRPLLLTHSPGENYFSHPKSRYLRHFKDFSQFKERGIQGPRAAGGTTALQGTEPLDWLCRTKLPLRDPPSSGYPTADHRSQQKPPC